MPSYEYFFSFNCTSAKGVAHGNGIQTLDFKINDLESIRKLEKMICENQSLINVTINNFILLNEEKQEPSDV